MLRLNREPANPTFARSWLIRSGIITGTSTAISALSVVDSVRHAFPESVLSRLSNYEQFLYMAVAVAFLSVLPLVLTQNVLTVSVAQLGFTTCLVYLAYSLLGVFLPAYEVIWNALLIVIVIVFVIVFASSITVAWRERSWSDLFKDVLLIAFFVCLWLFPLWKTQHKPL